MSDQSGNATQGWFKQHGDASLIIVLMLGIAGLGYQYTDSNFERLDGNISELRDEMNGNFKSVKVDLDKVEDNVGQLQVSVARIQGQMAYAQRFNLSEDGPTNLEPEVEGMAGEL